MKRDVREHIIHDLHVHIFLISHGQKTNVFLKIILAWLASFVVSNPVHSAQNTVIFFIISGVLGCS